MDTMTDLQRIEVRQSEIRTRLSELAAIAEPTEEQRTELETLSTEFRTLEARHRAAIIASTEPASADETDTTGEGAELRALADRVEVHNYLGAAVSGVALSGAEAELAAAAKVEARAGGVAIPWEALEPDRLEVRADATTDTSALDGGVSQRGILPRLFGRSILEALGVRIDSVPAGQSEYVLFTGGVAPAQTTEGAAKDAEAATFTTQTLKPKRLTGRYRWTVEQSAQVGRGLESAFRRDLRDAVQAQMSNQIINGDGTAPNVTGFLTRITAPSATASVAGFEDYMAFLVQGLDGIHATTEADMSIVLGAATYRSAATAYQSSSGETATEVLRRRGARVMATSFMPAPVSNIQTALAHAGSRAGDSVAAMWSGLELIRDPYTAASEGEVSLTWIALWDAYTVFRSGAYERGAFKVA